MGRKNPNPIDRIVGRNVRIQRMAKRVSQQQLAQHLGLTFQQVQKYEYGANRIGSGRLFQIAGFFKIPVTALFEGSEPSTALYDTSVLDLIADRQSLKLVEGIARNAERGRGS